MRGFYTVKLKWDDDAKVWIATNDDIGLVLESESYDALVEKVYISVPELLELNNLKKLTTINYITEPFIRKI